MRWLLEFEVATSYQNVTAEFELPPPLKPFAGFMRFFDTTTGEKLPFWFAHDETNKPDGFVYIKLGNKTGGNYQVLAETTTIFDLGDISNAGLYGFDFENFGQPDWDAYSAYDFVTSIADQVLTQTTDTSVTVSSSSTSWVNYSNRFEVLPNMIVIVRIRTPDPAENYHDPQLDGRILGTGSYYMGIPEYTNYGYVYRTYNGTTYLQPRSLLLTSWRIFRIERYTDKVIYDMDRGKDRALETQGITNVAMGWMNWVKTGALEIDYYIVLPIETLNVKLVSFVPMSTVRVFDIGSLIKELFGSVVSSSVSASTSQVITSKSVSKVVGASDVIDPVSQLYSLKSSDSIHVVKAERLDGIEYIPTGVSQTHQNESHTIVGLSDADKMTAEEVIASRKTTNESSTSKVSNVDKKTYSISDYVSELLEIVRTAVDVVTTMSELIETLSSDIVGERGDIDARNDVISASAEIDSIRSDIKAVDRFITTAGSEMHAAYVQLSGIVQQLTTATNKLEDIAAKSSVGVGDIRVMVSILNNITAKLLAILKTIVREIN